MALTTTTVVDTALDLLRESGLPGMSMRTLATRLGVQPSALYWHVPSKQALLTAVAERVLAAMGSVGSGASAAAELREVGAVLRAAVTGVPDGAEIVALGLAAGAVNPVAGAVEATCVRHGLEDRAAGLTTALTSYVLGLSLEEQTHYNLTVADPATPPVEFEARFELGLDALLAGVPA
ncbi:MULTISPECIES: TetR family transcriptional regulator [Dietzia]|uniref:TetR family transcriptional regulator n=1 Tax=Dietzia TaxID=37914 RepID=UPI000785CC36|nr:MULTISPECIES: TetR family transcriptional regulator [Dietzia]KZO58960.1 TetR family transcriptional regulator [Dietzia maris]MCT2119849.1 TetR family transcriptional regulator [Dietzia cinnamea]MCT2145262.1 TetR family transcriptional regulator [Dietzia cinnamea]MCT2303683.1 TetR family transcriptional regulator [Dietzia cinnamea]